MKVLPEKTVKRLSEYRRTMLRCFDEGKTHIYSHELAALHNVTAVQVRRDIMFIGYSSQSRIGYDIKDLTKAIGKIIDPKEVMNLAVVGYGNLGKALSAYLMNKRPMLKLVAAFDIDPKKIGSLNSGIPCYSIERLREIIASQNITMAILSVPSSAAREMARALVASGIKGILNFTTVNINVPADIALEESDIISSIEKLAYFVKRTR
ncbi:MAG: redox-sensing transcriptional repressor Rex [Bacteroidales bacterium]|nr:redox-sensing transcriptional repressor Rex [Bacteroidales bacterium]MBN2762858.1 redox-sensing transcriptional repressor Rex [Bacteroidales bacterium]